MDSTKKTARIAGLLYLLMGVAAIFGLNIPSGFIVRGDAAATANKIAASQLFYRFCVVSDLAAQILFVFLVLTLYQLLKGVNKRQATLMVALVLVQVPMAFANMLVGIVPLVLLNGADYWSVFAKHQLDAFTMEFLNFRYSNLAQPWNKHGLAAGPSLAPTVRPSYTSIRVYSPNSWRHPNRRLFCLSGH
jgi:hypothetical protein